MFNPRAYLNSQPDGFGALEIPGGFVLLRRPDLAGTVTGLLAELRLTRTFASPARPTAHRSRPCIGRRTGRG